MPSEARVVLATVVVSLIAYGVLVASLELVSKPRPGATVTRMVQAKPSR